MLKNYFKIALRTLQRNKMYSLINISGLAVGICACIVIYLIVPYELSFDQFHPDKDRVYRVETHEQLNINDKPTLLPLIFPSLPPAIKAGVPGLENVAPYYTLNDAVVSIQKDNKPSRNFISTPVFTSGEYFSIMPYDWLAGDEPAALKEPFRVVLSERKASQYFGNLPPDQYLGKQVTYNDSLIVRVAGIVKDWKGNTDFPYTEFISNLPKEKAALMKSDEWGPIE